MKKTSNNSSLMIWISFFIMNISLFFMWSKSYFILKNIDGPIKINHLQNFETNAEFENLLEKVNPIQIDNLLDFYRLDYFFMVAYTLFLILLIYKVKGYLQYEYKWNSLFFHKIHLIFIVIVIITFILDVLENWQLIYQTKYFKSDLIETCFYNFRYWLKFYLISIPLIYCLSILGFSYIKR